jgi:hypothetical protein
MSEWVRSLLVSNETEFLGRIQHQPYCRVQVLAMSCAVLGFDILLRAA